MDVRLKNGQIISNIPEGTTQSELDKILKLNNISNDEDGNKLESTTENIKAKPTVEEKSESYKGSRITEKNWDDTTALGKVLNTIIPQPEKIPAQLKRQFGLGSRGLIEGTGEAADFISIPIREGINVIAKPFQEKKDVPFIKPITESVINPSLQKLNVPFPENKGERISQSAIKMLPITGGPNALIRTLNPKSYAGKNIQKSLLESEGKQLSSGALMGGTAQYAAEEGVGEMGQLGLGTLASFLPFLTKGKGPVTTPKPQFKQELSEKKLNKAIDLVDDYESELAATLKLGIDPTEARKSTLKRLRLSEEKLNQAYINDGRAMRTFVKNNGELDYDGINTAIFNKEKSLYNDPTWFTKLTGNLTTRLKAKVPAIANRLRFLDFSENVNIARKIEAVEPFVQALNKIKKQNAPLYKQLTLDLNNREHDNVLKAMQDIGPEAVKGWENTQAILNTIRGELLDSGFSINSLEGYYPRLVKDVTRLDRRFNIKQKEDIDKLLDEKLLSITTKEVLAENKNLLRDDAINLAKDRIKEEGVSSREALSQDEVSSIYDTYLRGFGTNKLALGEPGYTKQRTMGNITEDLLPYYQDPAERLLNYIRSTQKNVEQRRFFGKDIPMEMNSEAKINSAIGKLLEDEGKDLTTKELQEVRSLLVSRFGKGEQSPSKSVAIIKDLIYMGTLANPFSAATQLGDLSQTAYQMNTQKAVSALLGTKQAKLKDLGLDNTVNADLSKEGRLTSSVLDKLLGVNFFKKVDKLGKEVNMNAALKEGQALAKNNKGLKKLKNDWEGVMGNQYDSFIKDLKSGELTDNVRYYLWHNLADQQPISLSEMPQWYLDMPNGRVFYALQSFALKQLDVMKRTIINEYKNGNKKKAVANALRYSAIVGGGNTGVQYAKDYASGKDIDPYNIPKDILFNTIKVFGVSEYGFKNSLSQGKIDEWFTSMWMPPLGVITAPVKDTVTLINKALDPEEEITMDDLYNLQSTKLIPSFGSIIRNRLGGGAERYNERLADERTDNIFGVE